MDHNIATDIFNFLSSRSPIEYTAITGWFMSEILGWMKSAKIKSVFGVIFVVGKAVYKAVQQVEIFEQSPKGQAIVSEIKKDASETPKT